MIRYLLFFIFFLGISNLANAQYKGQYRAQYASVLALETGYFGQNFTGEYFPVDKISILPSYTVFLPATGKASGADLNARYYLTEDKFQLYGLAGYGYYLRKDEFDASDSFSLHSLNIGVGGIYKFLDELGINPEIRFQTQRNDFLIKLGVVYFIN